MQKHHADHQHRNYQHHRQHQHQEQCTKQQVRNVDQSYNEIKVFSSNFHNNDHRNEPQNINQSIVIAKNEKTNFDASNDGCSTD